MSSQKSAKTEGRPVNEVEINSLTAQIQNLEAEKWALNNELKMSHEKSKSLSQQIIELQTYQARYQILLSEMELKQKESNNLGTRVKEIESNQLKV